MANFWRLLRRLLIMPSVVQSSPHTGHTVSCFFLSQLAAWPASRGLEKGRSQSSHRRY